MRLLIVTQKVDINDGILGFFHDWLDKLARKAEIFVIANYVGQYNLPPNVKIYSLGGENNASKLVKFLKYQKFFITLLPKCDGVFFHMCPEYVIAAGLWPKIFRKKSLLWYVHKTVSLKLKMAEKLVDKIFTASKKSFRLPSEKAEVVGHGIDVGKFKIHPAVGGTKVKNNEDNKFRIISVGRIAPVKNIDVLLEVAEILRDNGFNFEVKIAGTATLESDKKYFEELKSIVKKKNLNDKISFLGPMPHKDVIGFYRIGDLFVNFSSTGSLDKAVLEAMASGINVLTSNEAFVDVLSGRIFVEKNSTKIAKKVIEIASNKAIKSNDFARYVFENHNLDNLVDKIANFYA